jgi:hypothetical protein
LDFDRADMPYLSYQDGANSNSLTVQTYTAADGWQILGQAAFSPGAVNFPVIQLNGLDVTYVAFTDLFNGYEASAMRFNGTTWEQVGNPAFSQGISFSMPWYLSLVLTRQTTRMLPMPPSGYMFSATALLAAARDASVDRFLFGLHRDGDRRRQHGVCWFHRWRFHGW